MPQFSIKTGQVKLGADPAAGAEASITVPSDKAWRVHSFRVSLTSSATVATRRVSLEIVVGGSVIFATAAESTQVASESWTYYAGRFGLDKPARMGQQYIDFPLFPIMLPPGAIIRTFTESLQTGDNFSAPTVYVEEFANWLD